MQGASSPALREAGQLLPCLPKFAGRPSFDLGLLVCCRENTGFCPRGAENGGENPFSYRTPSRSLNNSDKTSPRPSASPFVREGSCSCTSLGCVERVIKIHASPIHKHGPEITDFPIPKKYCIRTMIGSAPPPRSSPRFPLVPQSQQPAQPSPCPQASQTTGGPCADARWDPAPGKHVGLRRSCFSSGRVPPPPS